MIGIDNKVDNVKKIESLQKEITKLIQVNNIYKQKYPDNRVPKNKALIIKNNNYKIIHFKKERDELYCSIKEQLKHNILKNNSSILDKNDGA